MICASLIIRLSGGSFDACCQHHGRPGLRAGAAHCVSGCPGWKMAITPSQLFAQQTPTRPENRHPHAGFLPFVQSRAIVPVLRPSRLSGFARPAPVARLVTSNTSSVSGQHDHSVAGNRLSTPALSTAGRLADHRANNRYLQAYRRADHCLSA